MGRPRRQRGHAQQQLGRLGRRLPDRRVDPGPAKVEPGVDLQRRAHPTRPVLAWPPGEAAPAGGRLGRAGPVQRGGLGGQGGQAGRLVPGAGRPAGAGGGGQAVDHPAGGVGAGQGRAQVAEEQGGLAELGDQPVDPLRGGARDRRQQVGRQVGVADRPPGRGQRPADGPGRPHRDAVGGGPRGAGGGALGQVDAPGPLERGRVGDQAQVAADLGVGLQPEHQPQQPLHVQPGPGARRPAERPGRSGPPSGRPRPRRTARTASAGSTSGSGTGAACPPAGPTRARPGLARSSAASSDGLATASACRTKSGAGGRPGRPPGRPGRDRPRPGAGGRGRPGGPAAGRGPSPSLPGRPGSGGVAAPWPEATRAGTAGPRPARRARSRPAGPGRRRGRR